MIPGGLMPPGSAHCTLLAATRRRWRRPADGPPPQCEVDECKLQDSSSRSSLSYNRPRAACGSPPAVHQTRGNVAHTRPHAGMEQAAASGTGMAPRSPSTRADTQLPAGSTPSACNGRLGGQVPRGGRQGQGRRRQQQQRAKRQHTQCSKQQPQEAAAPAQRPAGEHRGAGTRLRDLQQHVCRPQAQQAAADLAARAGGHKLAAHRALLRTLCKVRGPGAARLSLHACELVAGSGPGQPRRRASMLRSRRAAAMPPQQHRSSSAVAVQGRARAPGRAQCAMARWYSGRSGSILMAMAVRQCRRRRPGSCTREGEVVGAGLAGRGQAASSAQAGQSRWIRSCCTLLPGPARLLTRLPARLPAPPHPRPCPAPAHLPALHLAQAGHHRQVEGHQAADRVARQAKHQQAPGGGRWAR